ncbi:hypothetical protein CDAR_606591 [Caerostris darwini]|uniref:Uncharacterized protein n=1 Tax=Caerostris darwini TaxID=1538125 RepID=A0AAV4P960_9ARAC|nr:hypothetical protein CDAR_606591 [Caerostris darwini]
MSLEMIVVEKWSKKPSPIQKGPNHSRRKAIQNFFLPFPTTETSGRIPRQSIPGREPKAETRQRTTPERTADKDLVPEQKSQDEEEQLI